MCIQAKNGVAHKPRQKDSRAGLFRVKAVVFDFDGTLTLPVNDETTWEKIWKFLGYNANECAYFYRLFFEGKLSHEKWCKLTCRKFKARGLTQNQLLQIGRTTTLVRDLSEVLCRLKQRRIKLYLLSGSIKQAIRESLGELTELFEDISANDIFFGRDGVISEIRGTKYDFWGKADFLRDVINENHLLPLEVLFVGNSYNDEWASQSGVRTLCVNPRFTNPDICDHWMYCIRRMDSLTEILPYVGQ
jgi:phosphoserine phosphatase